MEWISVKDRLPESLLDRYIVCLQNNVVLEMNYSSMSERWFREGFGDENKNNKVTHWMPLPEPPQQ